MSWWLTRPKIRGKAKAPRSMRRRARGPSPEWDPQRTLMALKVLGVMAVVVATVLAWHWGRQALVNYVRQHSVEPLSAVDVRLVDAPTWMSQFVMAELKEAVATAAGNELLSRESLERALAAVVADPWVRKANWVRREAKEVWVSADYRRPLALVERNGDYLLVDEQGHRLPGDYTRSQAAAVGLPVILGVKAPLPTIGQLWQGEDLKAGVEVLALLRGQPYKEQVKAVQVRDATGGIRPILLTGDSGGMVFWGRAPGQEQPLEVDTSVKLNRLAAVYQQRGAIDAGGKQVYIYGPAVFVGPQSTAVDTGAGYTW